MADKKTSLFIRELSLLIKADQAKRLYAHRPSPLERASARTSYLLYSRVCRPTRQKASGKQVSTNPWHTCHKVAVLHDGSKLQLISPLKELAKEATHASISH